MAGWLHAPRGAGGGCAPSCWICRGKMSLAVPLCLHLGDEACGIAGRCGDRRRPVDPTCGVAGRRGDCRRPVDLTCRVAGRCGIAGVHCRDVCSITVL